MLSQIFIFILFELNELDKIIPIMYLMFCLRLNWINIHYKICLNIYIETTYDLVVYIRKQTTVIAIFIKI